jgi:hypothetical protein
MDFIVGIIFPILILLIVAEVLIIVMFPIYNKFKYSEGRGRRISGEILRDIGIALLVGGAFKFGIMELQYYAVVVISLLFILWGTTMKEDRK